MGLLVLFVRFKLGLAMKKEVTGRHVRDVFTFMSLLTNTPLTVLGRPFSYLVDVSKGRVTPDGPLDFLRGILTGKSGRRQRNC